MSRNILFSVAALFALQACAPAQVDSGYPVYEVESAQVPSDQVASSHHVIPGARLDIESVVDIDGQLDLFVSLRVDGERFDAAVTADDLALGGRSPEAQALLERAPSQLVELALAAAEQDDRQSFVQAQQALLESVKGAPHAGGALDLDLEGLEVLAEEACAELGGELGWTLRFGDRGASWVCSY